MKGKRILTSVLAVAMGSVCLFTTACADGLFGNGGGEHTEHTGWSYVNTDDTKHWESPSCHPNEKRNEGDHDYDDDADATCNICGHVRHVHTGWAYVNTDDTKHWESPSCHPDVKRNEANHVYADEQDTICDTCKHERSVGGSGHVHTGWAYVNTDDTKHWESPSCHPNVKRNEGNHVYDNDDDATCDTCGHVRHVHTGWAYVTTDDNNHWESPSCHPTEKRNEGEHVYSNAQDTTCNTCGHVRTVTPPTVADEISYAHAGYESAAFEWGDANAKNAKVKYKLSSGTSYTSVDSELIRQKNSSTARVDILGLKKNTLYDFQITTSTNQVLNVANVFIEEYDRSGYAHFNYTSGVGAYNDDGTLKSNAVVVYVDENSKNTVKATIGGKIYTGIVNILNAATSGTPLVVRILGTVGAATWKKLVENNDKPLSPDQVLAMDGTTKLVDKYNINRSTKGSDGKYSGGTSTNITQATLIKDKINELDTKNGTLLELLNLNSKIKYDASKDEFDSCWNDCSISGVKNVTVEGVGEDAKIFQWGFTFKDSSSIEVRNLTFDDYTEDACSFEGSQTSAKNLSDFKSGNIWVHHNTFEEGNNYWDVCNEQDKHDGDGSTDFKGLKNITISYNVYRKTHKTGLIGGGNTQTTANVTFHHNWYDGCKSRLPLARQANMHMYNNYYNATTSCAISLRANAYALIENCYFDTVDDATSVELQTDSTNGDGSAKLVGCTNKSGKFVNNSSDSHFYNGTDRAATVTNTNKFSKDFDTNSTYFYYKDGKSDVKEMLTASQVKITIPKVAGVLKHSNNITGGGTTDPEDNPVPEIEVNANDLPSSFTSVAKDTNTEVTQTLAFSAGIFSIVPTEGHNNTWKLYTNSGKLAVPYLQSLGDGTITIDLTGYTGSAKLEIVARTSGSNDTGRYYTITGTNYSQQTQDFTNKDRTDTFTLVCGYKYTLTCSGGMRFMSFYIYGA